MTAGVYAITHVITGRRYIGRAMNLRKRLARHRVMLCAGTHENEKLQRAWSKYGPDAFVFEPLLICAPAHLPLYEQRLIDGYDAVRSGFNIAPESGAPMRGRTHSLETRERMSAAALGKSKPQGVREKLALALKGKSHPPERVAANRAARSSAEARAATSQRMMGNQNGVGQVWSEERKAKLSATWTPERKAALAARMRENNPRKKAL